MEKKMKIYIAGPISGLDRELVIRKFMNAEESVKAEGFEAVNPIRLCRWSWGWWRCMAVCVRALLKCDGIMLMPGWRKSRGARIEYRVARWMGRRKVMVWWDGKPHEPCNRKS